MIYCLHMLCLLTHPKGWIFILFYFILSWFTFSSKAHIYGDYMYFPCVVTS